MAIENVPDSCIVTLMTCDGVFSLDLDVPSRIPLGELESHLLNILKTLGSPNFDDWKNFELSHNDVVLKGSDTLIKVGAFDGSILIVSKR